MSNMIQAKLRGAFQIRRFLIPTPQEMRRHAADMVRTKAGLLIPRHLRLGGSPVIAGRNLLTDAAQEELMKRWRFVSGSSRTIKTLAVGSGFADPTRSGTDLTSLLASNELDSGDWNDSLITPDSSNSSTITASTLWAPGEATGIHSEIGLKFDDGSLVTWSLFKKLTITGATQANPVVITTSAAHGLSTGDEVHIDNVGGMTEINNRNFTITVVDADEFSLDGEDGTGHTAYTSGGNAWQIIDKGASEGVLSTYDITLQS